MGKIQGKEVEDLAKVVESLGGADIGGCVKNSGRVGVVPTWRMGSS